MTLFRGSRTGEFCLNQLEFILFKIRMIYVSPTFPKKLYLHCTQYAEVSKQKRHATSDTYISKKYPLLI